VLSLSMIGVLCWHAVPRLMVDLQVYRAGARAVLHHRGLYDMYAIHRLQFTYPPAAAIAAIPVALLPLGLAKLAWIPLVYVPLGVAVRYGFRPLLARFGHHAGAAFALILGACALLLPLRQEIEFGQIDMLLAAACLVDCASPRVGWPRGLLVGLATAIKLEPGVFIVYLLITGRRRAAGTAALAFAGATALGFALAPADSVAYWTHAIFDPRRLGGNASAANQSVRAMVLRAYLPVHGPAAVWLALAAVVALAGFAAAWACWHRGSDLAGLAITGLLEAALSPVAWIHHLCWVAVALGVIAGDGSSRRRIVTATLAFALFVSSLPIAAQAALNADHWPELPGRLAEDSFGLAAVALIAVLYLAGDSGPPHAPGELPGGPGLPEQREPGTGQADRTGIGLGGLVQ
jgi:alpha-1,2-mannosyltransferase